MTRLHDEFHRLFQPATVPAGIPCRLVDDQGRTRAAVVALADGADAAALWTRAQADLGLPAPAIAVDGRTSIQLWFSLADAVDLAAARAFAEAVCRRCLPDLPAARLRLWPQVEPPAHVDPVPAEQDVDGRWSAFVAPDLAPLFAATPWLDIPPGDAAQARILAPLASVPADAVAGLLGASGPAVAASGNGPEVPAASTPSPVVTDTPGEPGMAGVAGLAAVPSAVAGPRAFLWSVMLDEQAPLALRVQAAVALLPGDESTGWAPPAAAPRHGRD